MDEDTQKKIAAHAWKLVETCESHLTEQSKGRELALNYYNGVMTDMPSDAGRSSVVSKDLRAVVKKLMPSIKRAIFSNDKIVEYEPIEQADVEDAEQATDYVNYVVIPESDAEKAIEDAIFDALVVKTGILKWSAYETENSVSHDYTGQTPEQMVGLDDEGEILDLEQAEDGTSSFTLRRKDNSTKICLEAVPRDAFLIHPQSDTIEGSPIVGEKIEAPRSDFVAMGYSKELVDKIPSINAIDDGDEEARKGDDWTTLDNDHVKAMEEIRVYEVYIKLDQDQDGIAELYRLVFADTGAEDTQGHVVLGLEMVDEAPYADVVVERDPHQFEGHSVFEDVEDIMRIKTALTRSTLDNIYWQNNLQPVFNPKLLVNPEAAANPQFGEPIEIKPGVSVNEAIQWNKVPFVADKAFQMLSYADEVIKDRTGITDASGGVNPEQFQNTSATAANLMAEGGIAQAEMLIRNIAKGGLRKAFKGILKLVIAHADGEKSRRVRGEWKTFNPEAWNVDMDCSINVGLGGGTKERDMAVLQVIKGLQTELLASLGAIDNPFVTPEQVYNTLEKITETAGFPSAQPYFTQPDEELIERKKQQAAKQPNPEVIKAQAAQQLEMVKAQTAKEVKQAEMIANRDKEAAQRDADLIVKQAEIEADTIKQQQELESKAIIEQSKNQIAREKIASDEKLKAMELATRVQIETFKLRDDALAAEAAQFAEELTK